MRLLLILALVIASVGFGPRAGAQSHHEPAQHDAHVADGRHHHAGHEGGRDSDHGSALVHICAGCALISPPLVAEADLAPTPLPRLPANPPSLRSFDANPIPPPPRLS